MFEDSDLRDIQCFKQFFCCQVAFPPFDLVASDNGCLAILAVAMLLRQDSESGRLRNSKETSVHIMSMFNTEEICMDCKTEEKMRPDYTDAVETDNAAIRRGDYNFPGIGLRKNEA